MHLPESTTPDSSPEEVQQLIRLLQTGERANIELALQLAEGLGNPATFQQYLYDLLPLYQLAFRSKKKKNLDAPCLLGLFGLVELEVARCGLFALPKSIGQLQNLTVLDCNNNRLQSLPESIGVLQKLEVLWCDNNRLQALPESIGALQNLQELYCWSNHLEALPENIGQLQSLERLDCADNQLTSLPEALALLPHLQEIDARNNPLIDIPAALRQKEGLALLVDE